MELIVAVSIVVQQYLSDGDLVRICIEGCKQDKKRWMRVRVMLCKVLSEFDFVFFCVFFQIDCELSKKLEWWDEKLRSEGQRSEVIRRCTPVYAGREVVILKYHRENSLQKIQE